jgi:hypothetical protein
MDGTDSDGRLLAAAGAAAEESDWPALWELRGQLRATQMWTGFFDVVCAIAGWHVDRPAGRSLFEEAIAAGLHQLDIFGDGLLTTFGTEPDWDQLQRRIRANVPLPPVELVTWPDYPPVLTLELERPAPEREALLRERVPPPVESAWLSALQTLDWVTTSWEHLNIHVDVPDALVVLDRVARGERFACVEYSLVLTQALNALAIPARRVNLRAQDYYTGVGRGHVVSEAWIDDLGRWVVLDGQNGAWWGHDGQPLGVLDLIDRHDQGDQPPMNSTHRPQDPALQASWFDYFVSASTTGLTWAKENFVPILQTDSTISSARLVRGSQHVAPNLAGVATGLVDDEGPALTFTPLHPYATGVALRSPADPEHPVLLAHGDTFRLAAEPGTHTYEVAAVTPYGTLLSTPLQFLTR